MKRERLVLIAVAGFAALAALMTWMMLGARRYRVEVCMEFGGRTACRTASGPTREEAVRTAADNACGLLASGMTESMRCSHSQPKSVRVLSAP
ncbi:MAG: hypothetical protein KatS3mg004_1568 [Bryobacteraceae bacterium]|nr:MAG: hypothetical protein KatS3mg004_1568 [Bryobacteraceae bacterium]